jgi:GTP-binding protein
MSIEQPVPLLAIVGRPNVGKSTLFNRLLARRRAITAATPGVTRDVVEEHTELAGMPVRLVDSGGIGAVSDDLGRTVGERALEATAAAAVVLLVVDVAGLTPEDEQLAERLRALSDRVLLVVNKVDHSTRESGVWDFHRLGYQPVVGVSAAHGRNIATLQAALADRLRRGAPGRVAPPVATPVVRLAIAGKPNTGKSTLLNHLLGEERALVDATPGTTRDPLIGRITHGDAHLEIIDTAGMRRRSKVDSDVEYYAVNRAAAMLGEVDVALLLVDANAGLSEQDKRISAIAIRRGVAVLVALGKWDLLAARPNLLEAMVDRIRFQFPILRFAPVLPLSGRTGYGVEPLLAKVVALHRQLCRTVPTAKLNQAVARWAKEYVPTVRGREIRVRYATQTGSNPVRFVCFLNHLRGVGAGYRRFLENRIRDELGFAEVPLTVEFRASSARAR